MRINNDILILKLNFNHYIKKSKKILHMKIIYVIIISLYAVLLCSNAPTIFNNQIIDILFCMDLFKNEIFFDASMSIFTASIFYLFTVTIPLEIKNKKTMIVLLKKYKKIKDQLDLIFSELSISPNITYPTNNDARIYSANLFSVTSAFNDHNISEHQINKGNIINAARVITDEFKSIKHLYQIVNVDVIQFIDEISIRLTNIINKTKSIEDNTSLDYKSLCEQLIEIIPQFHFILYKNYGITFDS